jgi:hypothetical protein
MRIQSCSEQPNQTSLSDVVGRFCLYGSWLLKYFSGLADTVGSRAPTW